MTDQDGDFAALLQCALERCFGTQGELGALRRLSGGANMETWSLDWRSAAGRVALVLRRRPPGVPATVGGIPGISLGVEARLLALAAQQRIPVPALCAELVPGDGLGEGYLMSRLEGETLPQRLLREPRFSAARETFAFDCGRTLAAIHAIAPAACPAGLRDLPWSADLDRLQQLLDEYGNVSPVHQLALNRLRELPPPQSPRVLCHGDFRLGNLMLDATGLVAVLDWELAHIGHAGEDLGYLCANVWRFGGEHPVGGIGTYGELVEGYCSGGGQAPSIEEIRRWELYAALGWGLVCLHMLSLYRSDADRSLERAAVGRRLGESEVDILLLLEELA